MTLNLKTNFKPIEMKCVADKAKNLRVDLQQKIKKGSDSPEYEIENVYPYTCGETYFIYGITMDIYGELRFLPADSNIFVPAWLFEADYEIPENWFIKSYMNENNILHYESYDYIIPNIIIGFKELVYEKDFILNLIECNARETKIFESYQEYEKDLRQKRAEQSAVENMYPYKKKELSD